MTEELESFLGSITEEQMSDPMFVSELRELMEVELCEREFKEFVKHAWSESDPSDLIWNWHIEVICDLLQLVSEGKIKRLLINIPPGLAKTRLAGVLWLAWDWIQNPTRYSIYATYAGALSNTAAAAHRNLVKSDWYQERWGKGTSHNIFIDKDNTQKKQEFENNHKGGRFSCGKSGEVTGRRGSIILFDDLNKSQDASGRAGIIGSEIRKGVDYLKGDLWTRRVLTNNPVKKTAIVGICQRLHHADVAQHCIDTGDFVHLNLPMEAIWDERCFIFQMPDGTYKSALGEDEAQPLLDAGGGVWWEDTREEGKLMFPEIITKEEVEDLKNSLGPINASAQLQQKPTPVDGTSINVEWFKTYSIKDFSPVLFDGKGSCIISVDATFTTSDKADWVVCQLWRTYAPPRTGGEYPETEYYLVDSIRKRMGVRDTIESILKLNALWDGPKKVVVEEAANGYAILEVLKELSRGRAGLSVHGFKPRTSKEGRVEAISPIIQNGKVFIPEDASFDVENLYTELSHFPVGKWDDQVDALSMALLFLTQNSAERSVSRLQNLNRYYRY